MRLGHVIVFGGSLVLAAFLLGIFFYSARVGDDTISVVGAATERLESDVVKWRITLSRSVGPDVLNVGYRQVHEDLELVKAMLGRSGVRPNEITVQPASVRQRHNRDGNLIGYEISQGIFVISSDIDAVEDLALNPAEITDEGVIIQASKIEYLYSRLDEMKIEMLAAATQNARRRAEEITRNSGAALGKVKGLRAGIFQIREPYSTEVSSYGLYSTETRQKDITVTVHATFRIN